MREMEIEVLQRVTQRADGIAEVERFLDELNADLPYGGAVFSIAHGPFDEEYNVATFICYIPRLRADRFFQVSLREIEAGALALARYFKRRIVMEICREVLLGEKFL